MQVAERAALGIVPKPLDAAQTADLVQLLEKPPEGEAEQLLELLEQRVPPGVDEAAYVKAGFLAAITRGDAASPVVTTHAPSPQPTVAPTAQPTTAPAVARASATHTTANSLNISLLKYEHLTTQI